ncbi:hypothetical protein HHI36_013740, partial [Cryptolaemus montrouzieri]
KIICDSEDVVEFKLQLTPVNDEMPKAITPDYLLKDNGTFKIILRDFVHDKKKADSIAPQPEQKIRKKPTLKKAEQTQRIKAEQNNHPKKKSRNSSPIHGQIRQKAEEEMLEFDNIHFLFIFFHLCNLC